VQRLSKDGFEIDIKEQTIPTQDGDGDVIEQDPAGGKAKRGSTVTITVAKFDQSAQTTPTTSTAAPSATPTTTTPPPAP